MLWLALASGTALCEALKDATGKQALKSLDEYSVLLGFTSAGALLMAILMMATGGLPTLGPNFGLALLIGGGLNILAFKLQSKPEELMILRMSSKCLQILNRLEKVLFPLIRRRASQRTIQ